MANDIRATTLDLGELRAREPRPPANDCCAAAVSSSRTKSIVRPSRL